MCGVCRCSTLSDMPTLSISAEPSDVALLARIGRGDVRAYDLIYRRYRRQAHALAFRFCGRHCIAEEVVQEAFLAVWRSSGVYASDRGSARGWILTIVRNRAIDEGRRRGRSERGETVLDGLEEQLAGPVLTEVEAERRERRHAVHGALRRLPAAQREAIVLCHFRGLTNNETAAAVGRSIGTVKGRIRLGHARLRRELLEVAGAPS
jgi:RNA polymerase sigma-70 factor (ECF subfamily)